MGARPFHLGLFLQGSSVQAWGEPWTGRIGETWMVPDLFVDVARALERACFDYVLLEDSSYIGESYAASREIYLHNGLAVPRQDPSVVATLMLAATSRIGIVPTFATFAYPPYLLARLMASLDQISTGRAGWNMVTGSSDFAARNFGLDGLPDHDLRYDMADEYMDLVNQLWASWEPGAIVADRENGMLVDHSKVHQIDFRGRHYASRGPLNSGPAPQGRPVIAQAGGSPRGRQFASLHADTIVASVKGVDRMVVSQFEFRNPRTIQRQAKTHAASNPVAIRSSKRAPPNAIDQILAGVVCSRSKAVLYAPLSRAHCKESGLPGRLNCSSTHLSTMAALRRVHPSIHLLTSKTAKVGTARTDTTSQSRNHPLNGLHLLPRMTYAYRQAGVGAMPKGPRGERRPTDVIGAAIKVARIATGEEEDAPPPPDGKDPAAVSMGKRGGAARAAAMTPERRAEIARKAAAKRWGG